MNDIGIKLLYDHIGTGNYQIHELDWLTSMLTSYILPCENLKHNYETTDFSTKNTKWKNKKA